ncbi:alpha/beta fold hydrolase [Haladaptatus sp. GCM10025707]|uniref:alpha/beta fold hydrolase n=1 Tax=Haladaptatus sp. GCM10025707 TaxID=3252658 RepID=UPI003616DB05
MATDASLLPSVPSLSSEFRDVNGVQLHIVTAGPEDGPHVLLLHGFPDFWYGWREQIPALVDAGYRVLVPDQRGYNLSEKPRGSRQYVVSELVADAMALVRSAGADAAHVVGHDWGGGVAWELAARHPESVETLSIINAPHPRVFAMSWLTNPRQLARSWYIFAFLLPGLPEHALVRRGQENLGRILISSANPESVHPDALDHYHEAWSRPRALTAMLNWYRAMPQRAVFLHRRRFGRRPFFAGVSRTSRWTRN